MFLLTGDGDWEVGGDFDRCLLPFMPPAWHLSPRLTSVGAMLNLGRFSIITGAALARERDMQYLQRMKAKWMLKTSMQNNATKQMHFRPQVRF